LRLDSVLGMVLARIIHEGFYCNRRYAAAISLTAGKLAARVWGQAPLLTEEQSP
jgi:hypothetical protein